MTSFARNCAYLQQCPTQRGACGMRLSSVGGTRITSWHAPQKQCCLQLHPRHQRASPLRPLATLAAADAFGQESSPGASVRRRVQVFQQALSSPHDREIAAVALPAFVGLALEPVVNAFNAGLVGHLGTQQLSAVSLGTIALNSCTFLFSFLLFLTVPEIAAAVVKKDDEEVSRVTAQSLWLAVGCGVVMAVAAGSGAPHIVAALRPPEAAVAAHATQYIVIRSLAIPAVLLGFVATGVFRGFKDTRTPLLGTSASVAVSFCLHVLLLNVLHCGVWGAAVAASLASAASCAIMLGELLRRGKLRLAHLLVPPPLSAVLPILERGVVLAMRNMVIFGMLMYVSTLSVRMGSAFQASFEVLRQMWMLTMPFFECLNVATQSLCAAALGEQDRLTARSLLNRLLALGVGVGAVAGAAVWSMQGPLIAFFTGDPQVVGHVLEALPMICFFFPVDAAGAIMDGSLLAAKQSNYMSAVQIAGSVVQYVVLSYLAATGDITSLTVWSALKILTVLRVVGGVWRNYYSINSAYIPVVVEATVVVAAPELRADQLAAAEAAVAAVPAAQAPEAVPQLAALPPPQPPLPEAAAALRSIEDDVMVLACAACTAATDMNPDMLSLKQRQNANGGGSDDGGGDRAFGTEEDSSVSDGSGRGTMTLASTPPPQLRPLEPEPVTADACGSAVASGSKSAATAAAG